MTFGFFNQYQTAEPWAAALPVHRAEKTPAGDVHLVVVVFDGGVLLLHLLDASRGDSI